MCTRWVQECMPPPQMYQGRVQGAKTQSHPILRSCDWTDSCEYIWLQPPPLP